SQSGVTVRLASLGSAARSLRVAAPPNRPGGGSGPPASFHYLQRWMMTWWMRIYDFQISRLSARSLSGEARGARWPAPSSLPPLRNLPVEPAVYAAPGYHPLL